MRGRSYLHHTGGMVSFSSSFHVDIASGVGAFASSTITAFAEYRPRLLTRFAVDALTNALGRPAAARAAAARRPLANAGGLCRPLFGPGGAFEVRAGQPADDRRRRPLGRLAAMWADDLFRTLHPGFRALQPDVRAQGRTRSPARAGDRDASSRDGSPAPLAPSDPGAGASSPAATSTTTRGGGTARSSSAAASCGSAPKRR